MHSRRTLQALGFAFLVLICGGTAGYGQSPHKALPPLSYTSWLKLKQDPQALYDFMSSLPTVQTQSTPGTAPPPSSPWQLLTNELGYELMNPLLLTDGSVILQRSGTTQWYKLTPDNGGSYVNGSWSQIASLPNGYAPTFYASAVLPDGRAIVEGGEYNSFVATWTNQGAIYDPVANSWTSVSPPSGWNNIGDAQSVVRSDLTFMLANSLTKQQALLNAGNLTWTSTGTNKFDINDEEGWTLLPSGKVLTVDAYGGTGTCGTGTEVYDPSTGAWSSAGNTPSQLPDCSGVKSYELGPAVLRPDGTVVAFGGTTTGTSHTAVYSSSSGSWSAGPDIPSVGLSPYTLADAPAALLPSGNILFAASPSNWSSSGSFPSPTHFFELSTSNTMSQVADNSDYNYGNSFEWNFLVLPTGQVLVAEIYGSTTWIYNPSGSANSSWAPTISSVPTTLVPGSTYQLSGTQLNGLSQGAAYGDDTQASTNYPIVRITNQSTGHVFFAKTSGWSTGSVAANTSSSTNFTVASSTELGASSLVVIANGISSQPVSVTISNGSTNYALSVSVNGSRGGTVTSSPSGISCPTTCSANYTAGTKVTLTATAADSNWSFAGWSGACNNTSGTCTVTMNSNQSVTATFLIANQLLVVIPDIPNASAAPEPPPPSSASAAGPWGVLSQ